jgi:flagellar biosynthetic protein FlhB
MSDEPDRESQTEEPTERRMQAARERGDLPMSAEVPLAASLAGLAALVTLLGHSTIARLTSLLASLLDHVGDLRLDAAADAHEILLNIGTALLLVTAPLVGIVIVIGIAASLAQNPPALAMDRILPDVTRLSPMKGFGKIYGARARVDLAKAIFKLAGGFVVVWVWFESERDTLLAASNYAAETITTSILDSARHLLVDLATFAAVVGAGDWMWSRMRWRISLRMTKVEVKREHKESEGDPQLRARMRAMNAARLRSHMMSAVPKATLIIANPTHLAIALRFVRSMDDAPVVLAKGRDLMALRIREIAAAHDIPIIEDRPLARAMFDLVEVEAKIPTQFFKAVAVIIHHVSRRGAMGFGPRV